MKKIIFCLAILGLPVFAQATFSEFYMVTTGSNTNSGSTTDNTPLILSSSGSFGAAISNRYISTAAVFGSAVIGQMASIYFSTTTGSAVFIASITAVVDANTIDVDTITIKYGTIPTLLTTKPYACKIGGAWADLGVLTNIFNARTVPQDTSINIKAGTYANTSNTRTFGSSGGNGFSLRWRGYKTTIGDQANNNLAVVGTDIPSLTWTTGIMTLSGSNQILSNMSITGAPSNALGLVDAHAPSLILDHCRVINSSNVATGIAILQNSAAVNLQIQSCYIQASTVATAAISVPGAQGGFIVGNTIVGGSVTVNMGSNGTSYLSHNMIYGSGQTGVNCGASISIVENNSIYQAPIDGIRIAAAPANGAEILNNYIDCGGVAGTVGIDLVVSSNSLHISGNAYSGCTTNFTSTVLANYAPYDIGTVTPSAFIAPTIQNFATLPSVQGIAYPSLYENLPNQPQSYLDVGASQHKGIPGGGFSIAN